MSRRWKWVVGAPLGLVGVGIGIYFAWGAKLEAEYERRVQALRDRGDYFAQLEKARGKAVFASPPLEPGPDALTWRGVQDVCELQKLRARVQPETAPDVVTFLLGLADNLRPDGEAEMGVRSSVRCEALEVLRAGLHDGTIDVSARQQAWDGQLASVEPVETLREILRFGRMEGIRNVEQLRRGEDPWAEVRPLWRELEREPELDEMLPELPAPWRASWYARPIVLRDALESLDEAAFGIEHATSEESLRETLAKEHSSGTGLGQRDFGPYVRTLEELAVLRLARIAMVVQKDARVHGGPRDRLDEYAAAFGGTLPRDPFTGTPFLYERHADRVVLSCAVAVPGEGEWESLRSALFERLFHEELLVWEVRWAPAKQND